MLTINSSLLLQLLMTPLYQLPLLKIASTGSTLFAVVSPWSSLQYLIHTTAPINWGDDSPPKNGLQLLSPPTSISTSKLGTNFAPRLHAKAVPTTYPLLILVDKYYHLATNLRKLQKRSFSISRNSFASWIVDELRS